MTGGTSYKSCHEYRAPGAFRPQVDGRGPVSQPNRELGRDSDRCQASPAVRLRSCRGQLRHPLSIFSTAAELGLGAALVHAPTLDRRNCPHTIRLCSTGAAASSVRLSDSPGVPCLRSTAERATPSLVARSADEDRWDIAVGMHRQGFDLQLTQYDDRGWRATFYTTGMEHSPKSATGTGAVVGRAERGLGGFGPSAPSIVQIC